MEDLKKVKFQEQNGLPYLHVGGYAIHVHTLHTLSKSDRDIHVIYKFSKNEGSSVNKALLFVKLYPFQIMVNNLKF